MIEIDSLYKYYGASRAIGPLSARIEEGEVVGLLGLNGAGKTTTLRILSCDLLPSAGSVKVDGLDVVGEPERVRALIGYLPDTPPLYDDMSVSRYVRFAAELHRCAPAQVPRLVAEALDATGLSEVAGQTIATLSHGYRQRVGIAQAIVHEPRLVILDEPGSGLDPVQLKELRSLVRTMAERRTVLISSHNLSEISQMCDRLLVLRDGVIAASGTEDELISKWLTRSRFVLTVEHGQSDDAVLAWLASLPFVESASRCHSPGHVAAPRTLDVELQMPSHERAQLSKAVVERGYGLLGLTRSERELEDVFARLAQGASEGHP